MQENKLYYIEHIKTYKNQQEETFFQTDKIGHIRTHILGLSRSDRARSTLNTTDDGLWLCPPTQHFCQELTTNTNVRFQVLDGKEHPIPSWSLKYGGNTVASTS